MRGRRLIPWMFLLAIGCARVGGESTPFHGIDFPATSDETVLATHRVDLPTGPFEKIGTVEAYAELEVSPDKLE